MSAIGPVELGQTLLAIQELDTRIIGLEREITGLEVKHRLAELRAEVEAAGGRLSEEKLELSELERKQRALDGELDFLSAKIKKEEEKLFSGAVMNPKELSAIQAEIISLRRRRDEMETEDLEEMEGIDGLKLEVRRTGEALDESTAEEARQIEGYASDLAGMRDQVRSLETERDGLKRSVDADTLEVYEDLLGKKGGLAVARIEQGRSCGGCHIEFTRMQIDRFQHEEAIFRCEYCRRILVK